MEIIKNPMEFEHDEMFRFEKDSFLFLRSKNLSDRVQVVTIVEKPFIFARPGNDCQGPSEVSCPRKKLNGRSQSSN